MKHTTHITIKHVVVASNPPEALVAAVTTKEKELNAS